MKFQLRMAWFATAVCLLTGCKVESPTVSVPLNCKPSRQCALKMAKGRARAEAKYERAPIRYVDTLDDLAQIVASTGGGPDELNPLLAELWSEVGDLPPKQRDQYTKFFARTQTDADRFDEAVATVRKIQDTDMRDEAWLLQATVLAGTGRFEQAAWAIQQISVANARDGAPLSILTGLAAARRPDLARQFATGLGLGVEGNGQVTLQIAIGEVNAGNDIEARRLADTLNLNGRAIVLREIVDQESFLKRPQQVLLTLRDLRAVLLQVDKPGPKFGALSFDVGRRLCQLDAPEEALDLVPRTPPESQPRLLGLIAEGQARVGHIDAASATIQRIPEAYPKVRDSAMMELVAAQIAAGRIGPDTAFAAFQDVRVRLAGQCEAARLLVARGQLDKARALLRASVADAPLPVDPPAPYVGADLSDVVYEQVELGFFADALVSMERIPSTRLRIWRLQQILVAQAARGSTADAARTLAMALALARTQKRVEDFLPTLDEAAKAGLSAEAVAAARTLSDWAARDTAYGNLVVPLVEQGHLDEAFAAAADVKYASSSDFTNIFRALSQKSSSPAGSLPAGDRVRVSP